MLQADLHCLSHQATMTGATEKLKHFPLASVPTHPYCLHSASPLSVMFPAWPLQASESTTTSLDKSAQLKELQCLCVLIPCSKNKRKDLFSSISLQAKEFDKRADTVHGFSP